MLRSQWGNNFGSSVDLLQLSTLLIKTIIKAGYITCRYTPIDHQKHQALTIIIGSPSMKGSRKKDNKMIDIFEIVWIYRSEMNVLVVDELFFEERID